MNELVGIERILKSVGIKPKNIFGRWKKTKKLLKEISKKWGSIVQEERDAITNSFLASDLSK